MHEKLINFCSTDDLLAIFGNYDENISLLEKEFDVHIVCRDDNIKITGAENNVLNVTKAIEALMNMKKNGDTINEQSMHYLISLTKENKLDQFKNITSECICITATGKPIKAKTLGQKSYLDAIAKNTIVLGVGPAGTGKTYLAVAMAVKAFRSQEVSRIILTRPAVEAGEKLGFLPGDLQTKVDPYLRPLYDALFDMFGAETFQRHLERGVIEVAPLAYMRGRTLDDSFIILDEAQNTTHEQMKMFLTRLGNHSKAVITGDITQIDLPDPKKSGLINAVNVLVEVDSIQTVYLNEQDVVRNRIVGEIIKAYGKFENAKKDM